VERVGVDVDEVPVRVGVAADETGRVGVVVVVEVVREAGDEVVLLVDEAVRDGVEVVEVELGRGAGMRDGGRGG